MVGGVEMLGGVLVAGRVATADMATDTAEPKMDPGIAGFEALLTTVGVWFLVSYLIQVLTLS